MSDITTVEEVQEDSMTIELSEGQKGLFLQLMHKRALIEEQINTVANAIAAGEDLVGAVSLQLDMESGTIIVSSA
jgi:hypothetical protein